MLADDLGGPLLREGIDAQLAFITRTLRKQNTRNQSTGKSRSSRRKNCWRSAMTFLSALGEFAEAVLGLAVSLGCALLLAFACLRFLMGLMTRRQYNVADDSSHVL